MILSNLKKLIEGRNIDFKNIYIILLIIICGIFFIYLQNDKKFPEPSGYIETFPASVKYNDNIKQIPKKILPKIADAMKSDTQNINALPDDYQYLYDYEKNFDINRVYGDYKSRLDAYQDFLNKNRNQYHNLDDKDINNLVKILNGYQITNSDIPDNFEYKKEFNALNQ